MTIRARLASAAIIGAVILAFAGLVLLAVTASVPHIKSNAGSVNSWK